MAQNDDETTGQSSQKRFPWTVVLALPFVLLYYPLYKYAHKEVNWRAAIATIIGFELIMFPAEVFSVSRGHWIWNPNCILGPTIFNVPIEEPLLYYWYPVLFVITLMCAIRKFLRNRKTH